MKFLFLLAVCGVVAVFGEPEAPLSGPYAPSGWRPKGPAFELPSEGGAQEPVQFGLPDENAEVEVTEEEVQYTGELATTEATTPFLEYGPPANAAGTDFPEDQDATPSPAEEDDLSVQGLPSSEPAQEFRAFPTNQRFTSRKNQFNAQAVQFIRTDPRPAKLRQFAQQNQFQRQRVATFTNNFQPNPRQQFGSKLQTFSGPTANGAFTQGFTQQFGRLTAPAPVRNQRTRPVAPTFQRFTNQRQVALDSYGAPAQTYGAPAQPTQEYGAPAQEEFDVPQQETLEPQITPEEESDATTEANDAADDDASPNVAISNAVASAKLRSQRFRASKSANPTSARLQEFRQPIFTYDQSGRLVRIF